MRRTRKRIRAGFTMVEILVVVIIIGILATLILPKFIGRVGQAKQSIAQQKVKTIESAIEMFYYDYGRYPANLDELVSRPSDIDQGKWKAPTVKAKDLLDPWGQKFRYTCPGEHGQYDMYTLGADGQEGGEQENADVKNWEL